MEKRKFLRLRLKIRLSCSDLHYIFHILNSIGGPLGPMVQTSPSAQSDRSRTIKKIIKPVWTSSPEFGGGPSGALIRLLTDGDGVHESQESRTTTNPPRGAAWP